MLSLYILGYSRDVPDSEIYEVRNDYLVKMKSGRFAKPLKSVLNAKKLSKLTDEDGVIRLNSDCGTVTIDTKAKDICCNVRRDNKAVESSRSHPVGRFLFGFLHSVTWTNRTGGHIRYTDEYETEDGPCDPSWRDVLGASKRDQKAYINAILKGYSR